MEIEDKADYKLSNSDSNISAKAASKSNVRPRPFSIEDILWELRVVNTAQTIVNLANTQLRSFKLRLVMEEDAP